MATPTNTSPSQRPKTATTVATALLAFAALLLGPSSSRAQTPDEERIWAAAQTDVLAYMNRSAAFIAQGHALAHRSLMGWYVDDFLPSLDDAPAIVKVFQFAFKRALSLGTGLLPLPGPAAGIAVEIFTAAFDGAIAPPSADITPAQFAARVDKRVEHARLSFLSLADRFEREHPSLFEDAMTAYLHEELESPGIHAASDYQIGEATRAKLRELGFPEPSDETALDVAERILVPMIAAIKQTRPSRPTSLSPEELTIDARIAARRLLYPNDPDRYCEGAFVLGLLAPDDCR